jgi:PAS domain S-box-containing protein
MLFDGVRDAVIVADAESGEIVLWNAAAEQLFGYSADEAVGLNLAVLVPDRLKARHRAGLARYNATGHGTLIDSHRAFELPALHRNGTELVVEMSLSPISGPHVTGRFVAAIIRDITERKKAEEAVRQADVIKEQFLSVVSHELRTPLNAITGFGSILDDGLAGPLSPVQHDYLKKMLSGAETLSHLVNDLLDMSTIQAGRFQLRLTLVSLPEVVAETVANLAPLADRKHQRIVNEVPDDLPDLVGDGARIGQVLTHLLGNAIKFTPENGCIRVRACLDDGGVRCEVADSGIGIAPEDQPKLFRRFEQLDMSATRRAGGTGLGLHISKTIVEAHGGVVGVESELGVGSTFWFRIPLGPAGASDGD